MTAITALQLEVSKGPGAGYKVPQIVLGSVDGARDDRPLLICPRRQPFLSVITLFSSLPPAQTPARGSPTILLNYRMFVDPLYPFLLLASPLSRAPLWFRAPLG